MALLLSAVPGILVINAPNQPSVSLKHAVTAHWHRSSYGNEKLMRIFTYLYSYFQMKTIYTAVLCVTQLYVILHITGSLDIAAVQGCSSYVTLLFRWIQ